MAITTRSQVSSDRRKWDKIFDGLVKMLKTQQEQLEFLVKDRRILEDFVKKQRERWDADIRSYEDLLSQMKNDIMAQEMARLLESAKSNLLIGLKQKEAFFCKLELEYTEDELADFKAWFDFLTENSKDISLEDSMNAYKEKAGGEHSSLKAADDRRLESEARRLKLQYQDLASEKSCDVSALLRENGFAWEQYRHLESELTSKLKSKDAEAAQANEKVSNLLFRLEQLQSSDHDKDKTIAQLKVKVADMEAKSKKQNAEIARLSQQIESLRKSRSSSVTPVLKRCAGAITLNSGSLNSSKDGHNIVVMKDASLAQLPCPAKGTEKGSWRLKRKAADFMLISETPKLFTSNFKVPKLKNSSETPKLLAPIFNICN